MQNLLEIRKSKGFTMRQVAEASDIAESTYCMIENGDRRPSVETAKKIAAALGFDWTRFFEKDEDEEEG